MESSHLSRTAVPVVAPQRPGSAVIGLLAALAICIGFWVLVGLTVSWLSQPTLAQLRATLLQEHVWRQREGLQEISGRPACVPGRFPINDALIAKAWYADGSLIDVSPNRLEVRVSKTTPIATTNYKNHGEYVSSVGGGSDAAHSCIGMPIK